MKAGRVTCPRKAITIKSASLVSSLQPRGGARRGLWALRVVVADADMDKWGRVGPLVVRITHAHNSPARNLGPAGDGVKSGTLKVGTCC